MKKINFSILIFVISFSIYATTCAPGVTFEDSGEFIVSSYHLGIAHPPGYPLYLLISKLIFSITRSVFFINLVSSFFSALAMVVLYFTANMILKSKIKSFLAVLFFSISSSLWANSVVAEVYALNLFLFSAQLFLLIKLNGKFEKKLFLLLVFINGLSLTNHQTSIFLTFIIIFMFVYNKWYKSIKKIDFFYIIGLYTIGLFIYAYLIIRSQSFPLMNWGNPSNIKNFIYVILREQYGNFSIINFQTFIKQIPVINPFYEFFSKVALNANTVSGVIGLIFLTIVFYFNYRKLKRNNFFVLLAGFILYTFFLLFITNTPNSKLFTVKSFFLPAWAVFYILLFNFVSTKKLQMAVGVIFLFLLVINFKLQNKKRYFYTYDYIKNLLNNLSYNSILFTVKDNETFPLWEMQYVENYRMDVKIINLVLLSEDWYLKQIKKIYPEIKIDTLLYVKNKFSKRSFIAQRIVEDNNRFNIYFTTKKYNEFLKLNIRLIPGGNVFQLKNNIFTNIVYYNKFRNISEKPFENYFRLGKIHKYQADLYMDLPTRYMLQGIANLLYSTGENLFKTGKFDIGLDYYKKSIFYNYMIGTTINNVYGFYKIGQIYLKRGLLEKYKYFSIIAAKMQPQSKFSKDLITEINSINNIYIKKFKQAEQFYKIGKYKQALQRYENLIQYNKPLIYANIGDCYFNLKDIDKAIEYYKKSIESDKNYITPYYNLGGCYYMKKDFFNAKKVWKAGLKIAPHNKLLQRVMRNFK